MASKGSGITVTDQFCGAGGSSQGARRLGLEVQLALNHWPLAIQTHNTNFPETAHDCADISATDPRRYWPTDILITSPECTSHTYADGKKKPRKQMSLLDGNAIDPAAERSRATMFDVSRFAEFHQYNLIIVENVVEVDVAALDDPLKTFTASGSHHALVVPPFMLSYYGGDGNLRPVDREIGTVTPMVRHGVVLPGDGQEIRVEDCGFRMLEPEEIKRGMAFDDDYVVLGKKREQVRQCGLAVTPPAMELLLERAVATLQ